MKVLFKSLNKAKKVKNHNMRKVNLIFQEILKFVLIFLLCFVWLRYFLRRLWLALLVTTLVSGAIYGILFYFGRRKQNKLGLKLKEKEDAENMFFSLACADKPMDFFAKLASKKHPEVVKHKEYIVIKHPENISTVLFADLSLAGLNMGKFMEIYAKVKKEKATKIVICCKFVADKEIFSLANNFQEKFLFFDEYATYQKLFKYYDCFPEITHKCTSANKMTFKDFVAYSFNKKRTKGYLFSAFVLILSGLFVRATIYYCIIASLLVVFALVSQFNPLYNPKTDSEVL